jgi:hypothetical protein
MPLRLLPLLFFGSFALLWVLTEHVGQRLYAPSDYDPQVLSRSLYFVVIGIGFARRDIWFWWFCLLVWPIQVFTVSAFAATMPAGGNLGVDADLVAYSTTEVTLILLQIGMLAAMLVCLLLPSTRAAAAQSTPRPLFDDVVLCLFVLVGITFVGLRGAETERAVAIAAAIADALAAEPTDAPTTALTRGGTSEDLAVSLMAACRPARHVFAAIAAVGHATAMSEAGVIAREGAVRSAAKTWPNEREFEATYAAPGAAIALAFAPIEVRGGIGMA